MATTSVSQSLSRLNKRPKRLVCDVSRQSVVALDVTVSCERFWAWPSSASILYRVTVPAVIWWFRKSFVSLKSTFVTIEVNCLCREKLWLMGVSVAPYLTREWILKLANDGYASFVEHSTAYYIMGIYAVFLIRLTLLGLVRNLVDSSLVSATASGLCFSWVSWCKKN